MNNNFKMMFFNLLIMSTFFLISSYSWFNMWMWLEINLISFISLMINNKKIMYIESCLIYFLIQSIASIILLFSIIMMFLNNNFFLLLNFSIMLKMGSIPFFFWLPLMVSKMKWMNIFLLLTWQKINSLIILMYNFNMKFLMIFILFSMLISTMKSYNYSCLKKIITFSSINQLSWMMMSLLFNKIFKMYLLFYFLLMFIILKSFKTYNLKFLNQLFNLNLNNKYMKLFIFLNLLSLGGLPPLMGFFPKMILLMKLNNNLMNLIMIIFSLIMLFIYFRMIYSMLLLNSLKMNKIFKKKKKNNLLKMSFINNLIMMPIILMM